MRVTKVTIPKAAGYDDGLEAIKMHKLGEIVLLAGKNGAGKTRLLNKIFHFLASKPKKSVIVNSTAKIEKLKAEIKSLERAIENNIQRKKSISLTISQKEMNSSNNLIIENKLKEISAQNTNAERAIISAQNQIENIKHPLEWGFVETSEHMDKYTAIHFVPKGLDLKDPNTFSKKDLLLYAEQINNIGVFNLPLTTLPKIQVIQDRWFNATHQKSMISDDEKRISINHYKKLNELVHIFLNTTIGRTLDGEATIFGFPLGKANLSDGQKVLLQFCLAIYSQEASLKDLIIILDEPENHLHPSVIIETIDRIKNCIKEGQIWIATHSIPLLAHFDPNCLWFVENNTITHAGKIPEKVLESLLGDENEISRLKDFISLPAQFATSRYAFECLFEPKSVMTNESDPQSFQIRNELLSVSDKNTIRILDYGAGQGRIISNIFDIDLAQQTKLAAQLDYIAYDENNSDKDICENILSKIYGETQKRYFNNIQDLLSIYDKGSFHVILLCNVLHEIDPNDWLKIFSFEGIITSLLRNDGYLLLVEDHQMPIGEKAYQKGFIVLDTPQIKDLFRISEKDSGFSFEINKKNPRLKMHRISKEYLTRINDRSRLNALKSLSNYAKEKILEIRGEEKNYQNGNLHGFWTQQFANAQLSLTELTTS